VSFSNIENSRVPHSGRTVNGPWEEVVDGVEVPHPTEAVDLDPRGGAEARPELHTRDGLGEVVDHPAQVGTPTEQGELHVTHGGVTGPQPGGDDLELVAVLGEVVKEAMPHR
jgi:hypothetical protein